MSTHRSVIGVLTTVMGLLMSLPSPAAALVGRVVGVHDGDTLTLLSPSHAEIKIRLDQIDAPELGQDFGQSSKQALAGLVFGKDVRVEVLDTDKYGRTVGTVWLEQTDVNLAQIKAGMAWAYRKYLKDPDYLDAETKAKNERRGLWSQSNAIPPWEFRHPERRSISGQMGLKSRAPKPLTSATTDSSKCGSKRFCREMRDCAEARFFLERCGLTSLDGNNDGIPCENLCR